jgi:hypothetical protein
MSATQDLLCRGPQGVVWSWESWLGCIRAPMTGPSIGHLHFNAEELRTVVLQATPLTARLVRSSQTNTRR